MQTSNRIEITWLAETREAPIDAKECTLLQVKARRDSQICHYHLFFPDISEGATVEIVAMEQVPASGAKRVRIMTAGSIEGVTAFYNLPKYHEGAIGEPLLFERFTHAPGSGKDHWWTWAGAIDLPKGKAVGLVVTSSLPTRCRAKAGGR